MSIVGDTALGGVWLGAALHGGTRACSLLEVGSGDVGSSWASSCNSYETSAVGRLLFAGVLLSVRCWVGTVGTLVELPACTGVARRL